MWGNVALQTGEYGHTESFYRRIKSFEMIHVFHPEHNCIIIAGNTVMYIHKSKYNRIVHV